MLDETVDKVKVESKDGMNRVTNIERYRSEYINKNQNNFPSVS